MKLEFVGQTARDTSNPAGNTGRLINGYREPLVPGGRAQYLLRGVPGMSDFASIDSIFMRALAVWEGAILAVVGDSLYNVSDAGVTTLVGNVNAVDAVTGLAVNTGIATVVSNSQYRTWNGTTLSLVATGAVTNAASVCTLGGYTVVTEKGARTFAWSALADPDTWSGLDFASAEITDDPIIRAIAFKDALYLFKESGFERWAVSGLAGPDAFQRIGGAQEEPGLKGYTLITGFPNGFSFIGSDGRVHIFSGGIVPISTPPLEVAIETKTPLAMFFYEQRGHGFICISFNEGFAWCYDIATGEWHERSQDDGPWLARASVKFGGDWYIGTDAGRVAVLSNTCADFGDPLVRRFVSRMLEQSERFTIAKIEAFPRIYGDVQGAGDTSEAKISLKTSRDGIVFGAEKQRSLGAVGAYETRVTWRALGQFRKAAVELILSSTTDIPLLAELDVETA